ncbi:hypothetical protein HK098_003867 [Nowakowskiella sp. JEL0407]|nr:hypothetical protein HK098_003867 [Nowakowskiella sp. JEL0407]
MRLLKSSNFFAARETLPSHFSFASHLPNVYSCAQSKRFLPHKPSLMLYRNCLNELKLTNNNNPTRLSFLKNNIRLMFDAYRNETDPNVVNRLIEMGNHDLEVFREVRNTKRELDAGCSRRSKGFGLKWN